MKKFFLYMALLLAGAVAGMALTHQRETIMDKRFAFRLKEPLLISTGSQQPYYLLPANTVLYHQESFAEGHARYAIEVIYQANFDGERLKEGEFADPLSLFSMEPEDAGKLLKDYPLSKDDLVRILKARQVTRAELEQMVLEWVD